MTTTHQVTQNKRVAQEYGCHDLAAIQQRQEALYIEVTKEIAGQVFLDNEPRECCQRVHGFDFATYDQRIIALFAEVFVLQPIYGPSNYSPSGVVRYPGYRIEPIYPKGL